MINCTFKPTVSQGREAAKLKQITGISSANSKISSQSYDNLKITTPQNHGNNKLLSKAVTNVPVSPLFPSLLETT